MPKNKIDWCFKLLKQYGCGPIPFVGTENAFYERHLVFDRAIEPQVATARERFEAFPAPSATSLRSGGF